MNDESLDQAVYRRLSRLLDEQAGGVMIGDLCDSFRPPLEGPLAWAVVRRLEKARLVWVSTLHGVVALSMRTIKRSERGTNVKTAIRFQPGSGRERSYKSYA